MKYILLGGVNGSGKSTFVEKNPDVFKNIKIINPDEIQKNKNLSDGKGGRETLNQIKKLLDSQSSFSVETTLAANQPIRLIKDAKEKGYETEIIYLSVKNIGTSKKRVRNRVIKGGHDIPSEALDRRYKPSFNNLIEASKYADKITIYENSKLEIKKILSIQDNQMTIENDIPQYLEPTINKLKKVQAEKKDNALPKEIEEIKKAPTNTIKET